jgi:large subunit ribosomal protein L7/L12
MADTEVKEEVAEEKAEAAQEAPAAEEKEAPAEAPQADKPKVEGKMGEFIDWIETISVLELSQLVTALEDRLGVTAAAPMAVAAIGGGGDAGEAAEEQTEFDVVLTEIGGQKIAVIKEVRVITGLGLKDSKDMVEGAPKAIKEGATKEEADEIKAKLEGAGATVEIK